MQRELALEAPWQPSRQPRAQILESVAPQLGIDRVQHLPGVLEAQAVAAEHRLEPHR